MFLLDTNVVSELRKTSQGRGNPNVAEWVVSHPESDLFLSAIVVYELETGTLLIERRDPLQGSILRAWLDKQVMPAFARRILPIDLAVVLQAAALSVPEPRPFRDGLIAATALVHRMTVVTRNVAHFRATGVPVLNPWDTPTPP